MVALSQIDKMTFLVVSIGVILTFKVIFTPLEYVPTIPLLSSHVINICSVLFKRRECPEHISSAFLTAQGRLIHRYLRLCHGRIRLYLRTSSAVLIKLLPFISKLIWNTPHANWSQNSKKCKYYGNGRGWHIKVSLEYQQI